ncbi:MAG: Hint domain-containing protein [Marinosulfonomonas sp.]
MTNVHLFAWLQGEFHACCVDGSGKKIAAPFSANCNTAQLSHEAEALTVQIEIGQDAPQPLTDTTHLAEDLAIGTATFAAGTQMSVLQSFAAPGPNKIHFVIARLTSEAASVDLVFASRSLTPGESFAICPDTASIDADSANFARGTLIDTPHGPIAVEHLQDGDEVLTPNGRIELITGIKRQRLSGLDLALRPQLRPICIAAGALVGGLPGTDLIVAQHHRLLLNDWRAEYLFGEEEILVPAQSLLNGRTVTIECPPNGIEYYQIALEQANLVSANGLWAETGLYSAQNARLVQAQGRMDHANGDTQNIPLSSDTYATSIPALPAKSAVSLAA